MKVTAKTYCKLISAQVFVLILMVVIASFACKVSEGSDKAGVHQSEKVPHINVSDITEITLERSACNGECPSYKVVLRRNGPSSYFGDSYVSMVGEFESEVDSCIDCYFHELSTWLDRQGYFDLKDVYEENKVDSSRVIVSITHSAGKKTVISNDSRSPIELWGIAMAIDGVVSKIKWKKLL